MRRIQIFRIHPILLLILFSIFAYGDIALYTMILTSLLVHEAGHLLAAYLCHVKVKSCVLLPYGAEITFAEGEQITAQHMLLIAIAGPAATICLAMLACWLPPIYGEQLLHIQWYLLFFNLLPIWSLDGGRVIYALILMFYPFKKVYEYFVIVSLIVTTAILIITFCLLPQTISLVIFSLFLWIQVWKEWRFRKYRIAFEKYVLHRLT